MSVAVWILAILLAGSLFWVLPQAASSRRLAHDISNLQISLSRESARLAQENQAVATLQAQLEELQASNTNLIAAARKNQNRIASLNAQIASLRGTPTAGTGASKTP